MLPGPQVASRTKMTLASRKRGIAYGYLNMDGKLLEPYKDNEHRNVMDKSITNMYTCTCYMYVVDIIAQQSRNLQTIHYSPYIITLYNLVDVN